MRQASFEHIFLPSELQENKHDKIEDVIKVWTHFILDYTLIVLSQCRTSADTPWGW